MQTTYHSLAERKAHNRPDKGFFCWSHTNMDGLQGAVLAQLNVYNAIHHRDKFCLLTGCHKQLNAHKQVSMHMQTCTHNCAHTITPFSARKCWILTFQPPVVHLLTLEISRLWFKSSLCPLINSQKSPWPGFYTWNPSTLYPAQTRDKTEAHMAKFNF